ncbi:MAG: EamA family transporter [Bacillota bacterium]
MKVKLQFIIAMLIFGSIGIFVKYISVPSVQIVQYRTIIGSLCLLVFMLFKKQKPDFGKIKQNAIPLIIAGVSIGASWVFLFEAYKQTSVGLATIVYYCAPIIVFFLAPIIFKEKITKPQLVAIAFALIGMLAVNVMEFSAGGSTAITCALISAILYAVIMIDNKFIKDLNGIESTLIQLLIAFVVITIYCGISLGEIFFIPSGSDIFYLAIVGIFHTGIAMALYIPNLQNLSPQNIAIFSYIDPASALVFSFLILGETLLWYQLIGGLLIFGGALLAQIKKA